jgi:hypothetical protein
VLLEFPELRRELRNVDALNNAYVDRQAQLGQRQKTIEDTMLARAVTGFERGNTSQSVINAALKEPRKMGQLISAVRQTDGALPALQRNVWQSATEGDATSILRFMHENKASLAKLFTQEHLDNIQKIAAARMMFERVPEPGGSAWVPRPLEAVEKQLGVPIPSLLGRWHTLITGRSQKEWVIAETMLRAIRGRAALGADDAMRAALYDPATAREFAHALAPGMLPARAKRLHSRLVALGIPLTDRDGSN